MKRSVQPLPRNSIALVILAAIGATPVIGCSAAGGAPPAQDEAAPAAGDASPEDTTGAPPFDSSPPMPETDSGGPVPLPSASAPDPMKPAPADVTTDYDLSVTFDFPQSAAGVGGECKPGRYTGIFSGIYSPGVAVWPAPIPVFGDIELVLEETQDGEFLSIGEGQLKGVALELFPFEATISGNVNCATSKLEDGFLSDGVYIVGVLPYTFEGPITADYDKLTSSFVNASWEVGEPDWMTRTYGGAGTWQATWTP